MKHIKLYENFNRSKLESDLNHYNIENYTINDDGTIDVDGDVVLYNKRLEKIPFKFGKVTGSFYCNHNYLLSLYNSPYYVGGDFDCHNNRLETLEGSPTEVNGSFDCANNKLISLEGMPLEIGRWFGCDSNPNLKELDSISNIEGDILCDPHVDISKFRGFCKNIDNS